MPPEKINILFFCDQGNLTNTVSDHIQSFTLYSKHHFYPVNPIRKYDLPEINFDAFDAILIDYSVCIMHDHCLSPTVRKKIAAFRGPKLQLIQDEYRWVNKMSEKMAALGINILFSNLKAEHFEQAYRHPAQKYIRKVPILLPGWVSDDLLAYPAPPISERPLDIVYRGRVMPYSLGRLAYEKFLIGEVVRERGKAFHLKTDISSEESARIYGPNWKTFLCSGRTTLGTECGASIWDENDEHWQAAQSYLKKHPKASFDEVSAAVLAPHDGNVFCRAASPKILEAIALKTPLILFPGEYSDIIEPDTHYIPLERDFSNFEDIVKKIRDTDYLSALADRAYAAVITSGKYHYRNFIQLIDIEIEQATQQHPSVIPTIDSSLLIKMSRFQKCIDKIKKCFWLPYFSFKQLKTRLDRKGYSWDQIISVIKTMALKMYRFINK